MKDSFEHFPVTLLFSPLEQLTPVYSTSAFWICSWRWPCPFYGESLSQVGEKHTHVGALGTLSNFLQAFPAASYSEISFVEWSQGVYFCVCVNNCMYLRRWRVRRKIGSLMCFCERTCRLYLNCACNANRPLKENLKFMH